MTLAKKPLAAFCCTLSFSCLNATAAQAAFVDDAKAKFSTQNIYFNRDYRGAGAQSLREEWGQGFILDLRSGFTEGFAGFGLDASAGLGVKLDSGRGRVNTGLLPTHDDGHAADEFSRLHLTYKAKISQTELRIGSHVPKLPLLSASTSRLLPQVFEGMTLQSRELDGITLGAARFTKVIDRASTNAEKLTLNANGGRYPGVESKAFNLVSADWQFAEGLRMRLAAAELKDVYRQQFFGLSARYRLPLGEFDGDVRLFNAKDSGNKRAGKVDNRALSSLFGYRLGGQKVSLGWQQMGGATGFAFIGGGDPYLHNFVQVGNFSEAHERSWQARYDWHLDAVGVPGLHLMARYLRGTHAQFPGNGQRFSEAERDVELKYVVPQGLFKDVSIALRSASYHSGFARDMNETRLIIGYGINLL